MSLGRSSTAFPRIFSASKTRIGFYLWSMVVGNSLAEAIIDALMSGLSHVAFCLGSGKKSAAGLHRVKPRAKIDLGFPAPRKCHTVPHDRAGKDLLPVRISNFVKTTFLFLVHSVIVPCSRSHRQPPFRKISRLSSSTAILHSPSALPFLGGSLLISASPKHQSHPAV